MKKAFITKDFIDGLSLPEKGELWISDTRIRGFGIRLWATNSSDGMAFCIRTTNKHGKSVRRTYSWWSRRNTYLLTLLRLNGSDYQDDFELPFAAFLDDARKWAAEEIARLKGRAPTFEELDAAKKERNQTLSYFNQYLSNCSLGRLVDQVLDKGPYRGWSQEYCDRLRRAFNVFDPHDDIRELSIEALTDGRLYDLIEDSTISSGNLRLLRSLLNAVFWQLHEMGKIPIAHTLPNHLRDIQTQPDLQDSFLNKLKGKDFEKLVMTIQRSSIDWRSKCCLELCFYFQAPISRVMQGSWSRIIDDSWFPYHPSEREHWRWLSERIDHRPFCCLKAIRDEAKREGVNSLYWFPQKTDQTKPITNIDRAWCSVLKEMGWPLISLSKCIKEARFKHVLFKWPNQIEREKIMAELKTWPFVHTTKH